VTVRSLVYMGSLAPSPELSGLRIKMKVTPDEFETTRDSHSLVILYALARDAQRMHMPSYVTSAFLGEAYSVMQDLPADSDLTGIRNSVIAMLDELKAEGDPK
jgi:hypothetical protein